MSKTNCKLCCREELKVKMIKVLEGYTCWKCSISKRDKELKEVKPGGVLYSKIVSVVKSI